MRRTLSATGVLLVVAGVALGQVTARQGVVASQGPTDERTRFKSPMILEIPLTLFEKMRTAPPKALLRDSPGEVTKYVCDAVSFQSLRLELERPNHKNQFVLKVNVTLKNDPGVDKIVHLTLEVLSKGNRAAVGFIPKIDAEEHKTINKHAELTIPAAKLDLSEVPTLKITMEVRDNS